MTSFKVYASKLSAGGADTIKNRITSAEIRSTNIASRNLIDLTRNDFMRPEGLIRITFDIKRIKDSKVFYWEGGFSYIVSLFYFNTLIAMHEQILDETALNTRANETYLRTFFSKQSDYYVVQNNRQVVVSQAAEFHIHLSCYWVQLFSS